MEIDEIHSALLRDIGRARKPRNPTAPVAPSCPANTAHSFFCIDSRVQAFFTKHVHPMRTLLLAQRVLGTPPAPERAVSDGEPRRVLTLAARHKEQGPISR